MLKSFAAALSSSMRIRINHQSHEILKFRGDEIVSVDLSGQTSMICRRAVISTRQRVNGREERTIELELSFR